MKRSDLALLLSPLPLAPLVLALAACGSDRAQAERSQREAPPSPFGFEMAMAGAAAAAGAAAVADRAETVAPQLIALTPEDLAARMRAGDVRLIDVRTAEEVAEGTIPGAEHIALENLDAAALASGDAREVVFYCRTGRRSAIAGETLAAAMGAPMRHLEGGILAWEEAGQPIDKP